MQKEIIESMKSSESGMKVQITSLQSDLQVQTRVSLDRSSQIDPLVRQTLDKDNRIGELKFTVKQLKAQLEEAKRLQGLESEKVLKDQAQANMALRKADENISSLVDERANLRAEVINLSKKIFLLELDSQKSTEDHRMSLRASIDKVQLDNIKDREKEVSRLKHSLRLEEQRIVNKDYSITLLECEVKSAK